MHAAMSVLAHVGHAFRLARCGGERFAVALPGCSAGEARVVLVAAG
jgi:hypothetical protein